MKKFLKHVWLLAIAGILSGPATAQTTAPVFHKYAFSDNSIVTRVSDNGKWAVLMPGSSELQGSGRVKVVEVATDKAVQLQSDADVERDGAAVVTDVTDDGGIVVGSLTKSPVFWTKSTGKWTKLPMPSGYNGGEATAVTPDGKYAVGYCTKGGDWVFTPVMWELATQKVVELKNVPTLDMSHANQNQGRFTAISADGRYLLLQLSPSYLEGICAYVYDRENATAKAVGYSSTSDTEAWTPSIQGLSFVDSPYMSPNGKWVTGAAYMADGSVEYSTTLRYNVETGESEAYTQTDEQGIVPMSIDNEGTVYGATPAETPLREWSVRYNGYWYPFRSILSQVYNINFSDKTGYEYTGTPWTVSGDGKTIGSFSDPQGESYVATFSESLQSICQKVDLLGNYTITPAAGSIFSKLTSMEVVFDREIAVKSDAQAVLKDADGNEVRSSMSFKVSDTNTKVLAIRFRSTSLEAGKKYTVEIPAGTVSLKNDASKTNKAITVSYTGRASGAMKPVSIYPAEGSELAKIDNGASAVFLTFDANVAVTDTASAELVRTQDGLKIADMSVVVSGNRAGIYPAATQYLYNGVDYKVVLKAGSLTDVMGDGANEALTINYKGTYERQLSTEDATLFSENFDNTAQALNNLIRYEGDHLIPNEEMQGWGFDADNQPWNFSVRDENSTDYCAASTSMYSPAGQSDDWMMVPQLEIPDNNCVLTFLGQSYKKSKKDMLKVVVWQNEENINYLSKDVIDKIKAEGDVVFNEQLNPGLGEKTLADDWTQYSVDLSKYAGKKVYICFWNNNDDQSALFVDSIVVKRNLKYLMSLNNDDKVVNQKDIKIGGTITANSDGETFKSVALTLVDGEGNELETVSKDGLALKKGDKYEFSFNKTLPLTVGEVNNFAIKVKLDNYTDQMKSTVKDLSFNPVKRVVLEEQTGSTCVNCPLGILAIENLEKMYGDKFIPISVHTYQGDQLGAGLSAYGSTYLFGNGTAPIGRINRGEIQAAPMWQNPITGEYLFNDLKDKHCWLDLVSAEMEKPADMEISGTLNLDVPNKKFSIPLEVRSALNLKNQNLSLFMVVTEDSVVSFQQNAYGSISDTNLGDWGKGGRYAAAMNTNYYHMDVVRGVYGDTYAGTPGLLPQTLNAGETYEYTLQNVSWPENINVLHRAKATVMLIDVNTNLVINAFTVKFNTDPAGIEDNVNEGGNFNIVLQNGTFAVTANGNVSATLYGLAGNVIATAKDNGNVKLDANGYHGPVIVKAVSGGKVLTKKFVVK